MRRTVFGAIRTVSVTTLTDAVGRTVERETFFLATRLVVELDVELVVELVVELDVEDVEGELEGLAALGALLGADVLLVGTNAAVLPVPAPPHAASTVAPATATAAKDARRGKRVDRVGREVTKSPGTNWPGRHDFSSDAQRCRRERNAHVVQIGY